MTRIDAQPDFEARHLGPSAAAVNQMLQALDYDSVEALVDDVVPSSIHFREALDLPDEYEEFAVYVVSGEISTGDRPVPAGTMAVAAPGRSVRLQAGADSHLMVIGGAALGHRHIWWNFVSSSRARIEEASKDWRQQRFGAVPGDSEFIPLPD